MRSMEELAALIAICQPSERRTLLDEYTAALVMAEEKCKTRRMHWRTMAQLCAEQPEAPPFVAPYLVTGSLTELDGYLKAGKTSLILAMMRAITRGDKFIGHPCVQSPVVYMNESPPIALREGALRASIDAAEDIHVVNFAESAHIPWPEQVAEAVEVAHEVGAGVLVVDTFAMWAKIKGDEENSAGAMHQAVLPLQVAAVKGKLAVLFVRHTRKSGGEVGKAGRGSSSISGVVDVVVQMEPVSGEPNRHTLSHRGRFGNGELQVEYEEGDFSLLGSPKDIAREEKLAAIWAALPSIGLLTATELLAKLKADGMKIGLRTLQMGLASLVEAKRASRFGDGAKANPFQFCRFIAQSDAAARIHDPDAFAQSGQNL